jgi:hypothetical protein
MATVYGRYTLSHKCFWRSSIHKCVILKKNICIQIDINAEKNITELNYGAF